MDLPFVDDALLNAVNADTSFESIRLMDSMEEDSSSHKKSSLDPATVKQMLKELLERIDKLEAQSVMKGGIQPVVTITHGHCNVHGLWLSTVAGAAIELIPVEHDGHIEIRTRIYDLPENPQKGLITSQWTGTGMISSESPTTINIVF
jgi:hypothetical protein